MSHSGLLENRYLSDVLLHSYTSVPVSGTVEWECPSNIALIKYWGKEPNQIPANPSVSFTLSSCVTCMSVEYSYDKQHLYSLDFRFDNQINPLFQGKINQYVQQLSRFLPFLRHTILRINTSNSFPHSSGIASSASSFACLAMSLCTIEEQITGINHDDKIFLEKASFLARLGSGSASRSVYGGFVLWGQTTAFPESGNEAAIPINQAVHTECSDFRDSLLIVSTEPKQLSSSAGHQLMQNHPYFSARVDQANRNLAAILSALKSGDLNTIINIAENEALSLHALIMSSNQPYLLIKPNTLEIIDRIRLFRQETGFPVGFTLDAGANVHLLYPGNLEQTVQTFINGRLRQHCFNEMIIHDRVGKGPVRIR